MEYLDLSGGEYNMSCDVKEDKKSRSKLFL